jgi:hypothetical protein
MRTLQYGMSPHSETRYTLLICRSVCMSRTKWLASSLAGGPNNRLIWSLKTTHLDRCDVVRICFQNLSSIFPEITLRFHHLSLKALNLPQRGYCPKRFFSLTLVTFTPNWIEFIIQEWTKTPMWFSFNAGRSVVGSHETRGPAYVTPGLQVCCLTPVVLCSSKGTEVRSGLIWLVIRASGGLCEQDSTKRKGDLDRLRTCKLRSISFRTVIFK